MVALIKLESVAAASARKPSWAISGARCGATAENAPTISAIGGVLFVLRQNRRLNAVQQTLRESNGKLAELAASLRETNADLSRQNIRIADANRIKEVYIGGFLKTISEYIYKLADTYRHVGQKESRLLMTQM